MCCEQRDNAPDYCQRFQGPINVLVVDSFSFAKYLSFRLRTAATGVERPFRFFDPESWERHDRTLEKFEKEKLELDKEMEKNRLNMKRQRDQLEAAGVDSEAADKDLYAIFQVTRPRLKFTSGTGQKIAEIVVVGGSLICVITGVDYAAQQ